MSNEEILFERQGAVATITLNRPDARNAWSERMITLMIQALDRAEADADVRVVILTGAGKSFCAGGDLRAMRDRSGMFEGDTVGLRQQYMRGLQQITRRLDFFEKPIIAAINGAAVGAGLDLALMCDIRVASDTAKLGSTFAAVGLIPGDGGAYLLTRTVGFSRAVELILTARLVQGDEALSLNLVHEIVPREDVMPRALALAGLISAHPASAIKMAKAALYRCYNQDLETALQLTAAFQSITQHTDDHIEAVERMLEKITSRG